MGGRAPRTLPLLPDGRVLNERALAKLHALDIGHACVEEVLRSFGVPPRYGADPAIWLPGALRAAGVRAVRHPRNYRYLFRLGDRRARRAVNVAFPSLPYPKHVNQDLSALGSSRAPVTLPQVETTHHEQSRQENQ